MSMLMRDFLFQRRIATKDFQCSCCGEKVVKGRVYTKTNYGRFCAFCEGGLQSEPQYTLSQ